MRVMYAVLRYARFCYAMHVMWCMYARYVCVYVSTRCTYVVYGCMSGMLLYVCMVCYLSFVCNNI